MVFPLPDTGLCMRCFRESIQLGWDSDGASRNRLSDAEWDELVDIQLAGLNGEPLSEDRQARRAAFRRKLCDLDDAEDATASRLLQSALGGFA